MIPTKRIVSSLLVALAGLTACNSALDDPDGPNVVLEAENVIIPPVNGQSDPITGCTFTVTNATATFKNKPKNEPGGNEPFNDIVLQSVHVSYDWGPGQAPLADADFGLGGTVPANGTSAGQFAVISAVDLLLYEGLTGSLVLTFHGRTVSGEAVSTTTGGVMNIGTCQ
jgi:hypothetical protein